MKNTLLSLIAVIYYYLLTIISQANNITGISNEDLRKGNVHLSDIPQMIVGLIEFFIYIAGTVSVIFIIIGAYQVLFGSYTSSQQKGKTTIIAAMVGFVISVSAWLILRFILVNFI